MGINGLSLAAAMANKTNKERKNKTKEGEEIKEKKRCGLQRSNIWVNYSYQLLPQSTLTADWTFRSILSFSFYICYHVYLIFYFSLQSHIPRSQFFPFFLLSHYIFVECKIDSISGKNILKKDFDTKINWEIHNSYEEKRCLLLFYNDFWINSSS